MGFLAVAKAVGGKTSAAVATAEAEGRRFEKGWRSFQVFYVQVQTFLPPSKEDPVKDNEVSYILKLQVED